MSYSSPSQDFSDESLELNRKDDLQQVQPLPVLSGPGLTFNLLNDLTLGDDFNSRNGRDVHLEQLDVNMVSGMPKVAAAAGDGDADTMRLLIFIDRQSNGAVPVTTDVLLTAATVLSPLNADNASRFEIICDMLIDAEHSAADAHDWNETRDSKMLSFDLSSFWSQYSSNTGTITDISTGALYVAYASKRGVMGLDIYSRLWFYP